MLASDHVGRRRRSVPAPVHCEFSPPEAVALYALIIAAHERPELAEAAGIQVTALIGGDPLAVINRAACRLYVGLRNSCGTGL